MARRRRVAIVIELEWTLRHHHEVFAGTQRYAQEHGWQCVVSPFAPGDLSGRHRGAYDGVIGRVTRALAERARAARVPLVNVWHSSPVRGVPTVAVDQRQVGRMAAEHLIARGFSRFAFAGFRRARASRMQEEGFRRAVRAAGGEYTAHLVPAGYSNRPGAFRRAVSGLRTWIRSWRPPVAVSVVHDILARIVTTEILAAGFRVPDDVAVVGSGDETIVCTAPEPTLTSIDNGFERVGYRAAELLAEMMAGRPGPTETILLPPVELVARGSTDAFAVADPMVRRALRFIAEQSHRPLRVSEVVAHVPVSWRSLERRFRRARGGSIAREIARLRLARVKRMLLETDLLIKQVATACGFADARRLCELFRRFEGISPGQYRRRRAGR